MSKTKSIKKLVVTAVSAMALMSAGAVLIQNTNSVKTEIVQASTLKEKANYDVLLKAGLVTKRPNLKAKPQIHLYKKAKVKKAWGNVNADLTSDINEQAYYDNVGASIVTGYLKLGSRKYYISYMDADPTFLVKEDFEQPTLMYSNKAIQQYEVGSNGDGTFKALNAAEGVMGVTETRNFLIPTHHNSIKATDWRGVTRELVPVYAVAQAGTPNKGTYYEFIEKKDFDQLKKGTKNNKKLTLTGQGKLYQKKGYATTNVTSKKWFKDLKKEANSMLKSKKKRKAYTKQVKSIAKDCMNVIKDTYLG